MELIGFCGRKFKTLVMGRGKLSMKPIGNEKSRKTTFQKRKASLLRKAYELSTLCDVRACVFVYCPDQNDRSPPQVHTWPSSQGDINDIIASYKANCLHKRACKTFNLLDFFYERKKKIETDMSKLRKDVAEARFPKWDERLDHLLEDQLRVLMVELDSKIEMTNGRIEMVVENVEEGTSEESSQTLHANMMQKQVMSFDEEESFGLFETLSMEQTLMSFDEEESYGMFETLSMEQTQATIPAQHQDHQLQTMVDILQMDDGFENLSEFLFEANGPSEQIQLSYENDNYSQNHPNSYDDPTNGMVMDNTQSYSMCHHGLPPTQPILPLSYMQMQLTDDQMMMACPSNSQMALFNDASTQVNDQFDYFDYEYLF